MSQDGRAPAFCIDPRDHTAPQKLRGDKTRARSPALVSGGRPKSKPQFSTVPAENDSITTLPIQRIIVVP